MKKSDFCTLYKKTQISSVTTYLFFAALIKESPKSLNSIINSLLLVSVDGGYLSGTPNKRARIIDIPLNIPTPVPEVPTVKLTKLICNLLKFYATHVKNGNRMQNVADFFFFFFFGCRGGGVFYQCEEYTCMLYEI